MNRERVVCSAIAAAVAAPLLLGGCGDDDDDQPAPTASEEAQIPDVSGLAWLGGDRFLAVHDAKNPDEIDLPRLSILRLPSSLEGIESTDVEVEWPETQGPSNDLESADRVPGANQVLFGESGDDGGDFQRVFLGEYSDDRVEIVSSADWPRPVENVEGVAVGRVGPRLVLLYAERAQGEPSTSIQLAPMRLDPLRFGKPRRVTYVSPKPQGPQARPVTGLTVDSAGTIYAVSAFDPDADEGPFASYVWRIGELRAGPGGRPEVALAQEPQRLGTFDGFKVESVAVSETADGATVVAGTDDEFYGGTLRPLRGSP